MANNMKPTSYDGSEAGMDAMPKTKLRGLIDELVQANDRLSAANERIENSLMRLRGSYPRSTSAELSAPDGDGELDLLAVLVGMVHRNASETEDNASRLEQV